MKLSGLAGILWVAGFVLNCILFVILCVRGRAKKFPVFFAFIGFCAARSLILFWVWRRSQWDLYRTLYVVFMVLDICLQFGMIWEIASRVFRRRGVWVPDVRIKLAIFSIVSLVVAGILTALQRPVGQNWVQGTVLRAELFPSVLISELFIVMLVLSSEAGLNWKSHVVGIALGLAVFNLPSVVIDTIDNILGFDRQGYLNSALGDARRELYLACLVYWCYSMWKSEPEPRIMSPRMEGQVSALRDALVHRDSHWGKR